jgi:ABC-type polysaccharide/polyol phosphate transport system ATPase subunit
VKGVAKPTDDAVEPDVIDLRNEASNDERPLDVVLRGVGKRYTWTVDGPRRWANLPRLGRRQQRWVLRDVNLGLRSGEAVGLVGVNGSGKSTLLRIVGGTTQPTAGKVVLNRPPSGLLSLGEGMHPFLSGAENVVTDALLAGWSRRDARALVPHVAKLAGLEKAINDPMRTYSSGMQARLAFAAGCLLDPEVLLLDEVLAVGDEGFQATAVDHLETLRDQGTTIVLASHDLDRVVELCDRVVWLSGGRLVAAGDPDEVITAFRGSLGGRGPDWVDDRDEVEHRPSDIPRVRLTGVRMLGGRGTPVSKLRGGRGGTICVTFDNGAPGQHIAIVVSLREEGSESSAVDLDSLDFGVNGLPAGEGVVEVVLDRVTLPDGRYWIDVGAFDADWRQLDFWYGACPLEIVGQTTEPVAVRKWRIR